MNELTDAELESGELSKKYVSICHRFKGTASILGTPRLANAWAMADAAGNYADRRRAVAALRVVLDATCVWMRAEGYVA